MKSSMICSAFVAIAIGAGLYYFAQPGQRNRHIGHTEFRIAISPDDKQLIFSAHGLGGADLFTLNLADMKVSRLTNTNRYELRPAFSPDGKQVVCSAGSPGQLGDHIFMLDLENGKKTQLTSGKVNDCDPEMSPDGSTIVFARDKTHSPGGFAASWDQGGVVMLLDVETKMLRQLTEDSDFAYEPGFSFAGNAIVYATLEGIRKISIDNWTISSIEDGSHDNGVRDSVFLADGSLMAYTKGKFSRDVEIYVRDLATNHETKLTNGNGAYRSLVFSSDGKQLYFLQEVWLNGPSGVPSFNLCKIDIQSGDLEQIADYSLFDDPMSWKPK